jgi:uncharacterized membrane protein
MTAIHSTTFPDSKRVFQIVTRITLAVLVGGTTCYTIAALVYTQIAPLTLDVSTFVFGSVQMVVSLALLLYLIIAFVHLRRTRERKLDSFATLMKTMVLLLASSALICACCALSLITIVLENFYRTSTSLRDNALFFAGQFGPQTLVTVVILAMLTRFFAASAQLGRPKDAPEQYVPLNDGDDASVRHSVVPSRYQD